MKRQAIETTPLEMIHIGLRLMEEMSGLQKTNVVIINKTKNPVESDKWEFERYERTN